MRIEDAIKFNDVCFFKSGHRIFDKLNLALQCGRWHGIVGRSGVGKTSLLRLLANLEVPDSGRIQTKDNRSLSQQIVYMSQEDGLLPWLTVLDNVQNNPSPPQSGGSSICEPLKAAAGSLRGPLRFSHPRWQCY